MLTSRLHVVIALASVILIAGSESFGTNVVDAHGVMTMPAVSVREEVERGGTLMCLECTAEWDEEGDPEDPDSWTHWFDLGSAEQCDTPVEQQQNEDCARCNGTSACHDTAQVGKCHTACADVLESPEQIALAVRESDVGLLADILMHGPKNVVWNEERGIIQPLRSCGLVAENIALSPDLARALSERLEYYNSQGLGFIQ